MQTGLENADLLHGINFSAQQEKSGYQKVLSSKLKFLYYSPCHYDLQMSWRSELKIHI